MAPFKKDSVTLLHLLIKGRKSEAFLAKKYRLGPSEKTQRSAGSLEVYILLINRFYDPIPPLSFNSTVAALSHIFGLFGNCCYFKPVLKMCETS